MKRKQVWRYYCDFCKKANCSSFSISKHERGCTANPDRKCRVCPIIASGYGDDLLPLSLPELISMLSEVGEDESRAMLDEGNGCGTRAWKLLARLRNASHGCPACILAAIRQSPASISNYLAFDFKAEMKAFWEEHNNYPSD